MRFTPARTTVMRRVIVGLVALLVACGGVALSAPASSATQQSAVAAAAKKKTSVLRTNGQYWNVTVRGSGKVRIAARASACKGFPVMRVWVDGKRDRSIRLSKRSAKWYSSRKTYRAGKHRVRIIMRSDKKVTRKKKVVCNRSIRLVKVRMARGGVPVVPGDEDGAFTLAVIGDTQDETFGGRTESATRTQWLATHQNSQDIRFVAQTGDLTSFGWRVPSQYSVATAAMQKLTNAGLPWQVTAGNHDTRVVGKPKNGASYGGDPWSTDSRCSSTNFGLTPARPCVASDSNALQRRADELLAALPNNPSGGLTSGRYVENPAQDPYAKSLSSWVTFNAVGRRWLVLNLELWPRANVVAWAQGVVASHPDHNVIIQTHDYLTQGGGLAGNGGYGSQSAQYVADNLGAKYSNVKIVLSGHEGLQGSKVFTYGGNRVVAYLGNEDSRGVAVSRLVDINVRTGTISSRVWTSSANLSTPATAVTTSAAGFTFR